MIVYCGDGRIEYSCAPVCNNLSNFLDVFQFLHAYLQFKNKEFKNRIEKKTKCSANQKIVTSRIVFLTLLAPFHAGFVRTQIFRVYKC